MSTPIVQNLLVSSIILSRLLIDSTLAQDFDDDDFCQLPCGPEENSGCNCKSAGDWCIDPDKTLEERLHFRMWMVEIHNDLRNKLALGRDHRAGMSVGVSNMHTIDYDYNLERTAMCYAYKCPKGHDWCRKTSRFPQVGQNMYFFKGYVGNDMKAMRETVIGWYNELGGLNSKVLSKLVASYEYIEYYANFTQIAWAETTHIGCARFFDKRTNVTGLFCNYGPAGNVRHEPMFIPGKECYRCEDESCNYMWRGLCGQVTLKGVVAILLPISKEPGLKSTFEIVLCCVLVVIITSGRL